MKANASFLKSKIVLGTAQFGHAYGIANTKGQILRKEVFDILDYAQDVGIHSLDTAFDYGNSESVIGEYINEKGKDFHIISKLPSRKNHSDESVTDILKKSLASLKRKNLYGYLVHRFNDFLTEETLWEEMIQLKDQGVVEKVGFSLYYPEELEVLLRRRVDFNMVQVPYSIFDRRFEKYFDLLKAQGVDIYVRSIFLQGLVFLDPAELQGPLCKAKKQIEILRRFSQNHDLAISAICLNYILSNPRVDKAVIGVDGLDHFKSNIMGLELFDEVKGLKDECNDLVIEDETILIPSKWNMAHENRS